MCVCFLNLITIYIIYFHLCSGFEFEETFVEEDEEPSRVSRDNKLLLGRKEQGVLSGFKVASSSEYQLERLWSGISF